MKLGTALCKMSINFQNVQVLFVTIDCPPPSEKTLSRVHKMACETFITEQGSNERKLPSEKMFNACLNFCPFYSPRKAQMEVGVRSSVDGQQEVVVDIGDLLSLRCEQQ